jgi:hypothetical protein
MSAMWKASRSLRRWFSVGIGGVADGAPPLVFNRDLKRIQRDAAALRSDRALNSLLREEIAERLLDRLDDTNRRWVFLLRQACAVCLAFFLYFEGGDFVHLQRMVLLIRG